jgi:hypothetical protein
MQKSVRRGCRQPSSHSSTATVTPGNSKLCRRFRATLPSCAERALGYARIVVIKREDDPLPDDFETMAVEFADRVRRFVLREVEQALDGMPDAQRKIRRLGWRSRPQTDFEIRAAAVEAIQAAGRSLTFLQLKRNTSAPKGRLTLVLRALVSEKKITTTGTHRAKRYRLAK